jgi:hypothetical protein
LLKNLLKKVLSGGAEGVEQALQPGAGGPGRGPVAAGDAHARHSHGIEQFLSNIRTHEPLTLLDVGGVTQANVEFLTSLGHRLYSEELLRSLDSARREPEAEFIENFLRANLDFPAGWFDGVLLWDTLEFLPPALLKATMDRIFSVSKPGAYLLAFFHADEKAVSVPSYSYRIQDACTLALANRHMRQPAQLFNNRSVEKLFQRFQSVKFFLTRDHLREVIVRR